MDDYKNTLREWLTPGLGLKRWLAISFFGLFQVATGLALVFERIKSPAVGLLTFRYVPKSLRALFLLFAGGFTSYVGWRELSQRVLRLMIPERQETSFGTLIRERQRTARGRHVVVIGGDPGLTPIVKALQLTGENLKIEIILPATERGALAQELRRTLNLSSEQIIFPTTDETLLYATLPDGRLLEGSSAINRYGGGELSDLFLSRDLRRVQVWEADGEARSMASKLRDYMPNVSEQALTALAEAELIVFTPGHIYSQILANLTMPRFAQAVRESRALKVLVANLMSEPGLTDEWTVAHHLSAIQRVANLTMDYVIANEGKISETMRDQYRNEGATSVPMQEEEITGRLTFADTGEQTAMLEGAVLLSGDLVTERPQMVTFQRGGDTIIREMPVVRHDPRKVAPFFEQVLAEVR